MHCGPPAKANGLRLGSVVVLVFPTVIFISVAVLVFTLIVIIPLVVVVLAALPLWFDYARIISNVTIDPGYSLVSTPLLLIPIVARMSTIRRGAVA